MVLKHRWSGDTWVGQSVKASVLIWAQIMIPGLWVLVLSWGSQTVGSLLEVLSFCPYPSQIIGKSLIKPMEVICSVKSKLDSVTVNFMWAELGQGRPGVWRNTILVCPSGSLWMRLTFESVDWVKITLPIIVVGKRGGGGVEGGPHIQSVEVLHGIKGWLERRHSLFWLSSCWDTGLCLPLHWNLHHPSSQVSGLGTQAETSQSALKGLQLAN